jgi:glycosyltransferase involved in cell wall biosynthesis
MLSVVVCTYNGEKYVQQQLESILNQTIRPDEIIVSDDGSSDNTVALVREALAPAHSTGIAVTILTRDTPLGVAGNFSEALAQAQGDLIALSDQDDVWSPEKLEVLTEVFSHHPDVVLVHSDATLINSSGKATGTLMATLDLTPQERRALLERRGLVALLRRNVVTGATVVLRRSLLEHALPIPDGWIHDEWLAMVAALQDGLLFDPRAVVGYRIHPENVIGASALNSEQVSTRLRQTRSDFFGLKNQRNQALHSLVAQNPDWLPDRHRQALADRLEHDDWRSHLPPNRLFRLIPVLARYFRGHYSRFARGYLDVVRDLLQRP